MKNIKIWFYSLMFLALNFPAIALGQGEVYGPAPMPVLYGPGPLYLSDPWYIIAGRLLLFPVLPIAVVITIIIFIIRRAKKKK